MEYGNRRWDERREMTKRGKRAQAMSRMAAQKFWLAKLSTGVCKLLAGIWCTTHFVLSEISRVRSCGKLGDLQITSSRVKICYETRDEPLSLIHILSTNSRIFIILTNSLTA